MIDSSNALPIGTILRSNTRTYTIVEVLGQGGFGITYHAKSTVTVDNITIEGQFAIKEHFVGSYCERDCDTQAVSYSRPVANEVENSRKDFLSEARRLRDLSKNKNRHPNIVCVNETFEANNTAYFVMEYLEGESLSNYVKRRGPLSDYEMRSIMTPIIDAVAFLHKEYITHLDIKPANIMLTRDDTGSLRPVLIDFGLSRHFDPKTEQPSSSIQQAGFSIGYAPIEQVEAFSHFYPGTDVYSLGATMLYALTGKTPDSAANLNDVAVFNSIPAGLPVSTVAAITEAMRHFRVQRPKNATALLSILSKDDYTKTFDNEVIVPEIYNNTNTNQATEQIKHETNSKPIVVTHSTKSRNGLYIGIGVVVLLALICVAWLTHGFGLFDEDKQKIGKATEIIQEEPAPDQLALPKETTVENTEPAPYITYSVRRNDPLFDENAQLCATIDGEEVVIGSIGYVFGPDNMGNMDVFAQDDFDGNGIIDALVRDANLGNAGGTTWAFITYSGDYSFNKSNLFSEYSFYTPEITTVNGQKVLDFVKEDMGQRIVKERHGLRDGQAISLNLPMSKTQAYTPLKSINMDTMGDYGSFYCDLNGDGESETIESTGTFHFGRTFKFTMNGVNYEFSINTNWGSGMLYVLKSKTNGMRDLMAEQETRFIYKWDGSTYNSD